MSPNTSAKTSATKYTEYYFSDGDIFVRVENCMFKIDRHHLTRYSTHFKTLINPSSGLSDSNPFLVEDATSEEFANFLWACYNLDFSYKADFDKWKQILTLARQWGITRIEKLCIRELQDMKIDPVDKIELYQKFNLSPNYLRTSFAELVMRPLPLSIEEGERLGLPTTIRLFEARERARNPDLSVTLQELEPIIEDVFGLLGSTPPLTATSPQTTSPQEIPITPTTDDYPDNNKRRNKNRGSRGSVSLNDMYRFDKL